MPFPRAICFLKAVPHCVASGDEMENRPVSGPHARHHVWGVPNSARRQSSPISRCLLAAAHLL